MEELAPRPRVLRARLASGGTLGPGERAGALLWPECGCRPAFLPCSALTCHCACSACVRAWKRPLKLIPALARAWSYSAPLDGERAPGLGACGLDGAVVRRALRLPLCAPAHVSGSVRKGAVRLV